MNASRTKKASLIMTTSVIRQLLSLILTFVSRTIFISFLGRDYLGLNGLFSNILSLLSLAELGIGSAISFYLYKPIAVNDYKKINCLMNFYKTAHRIIGLTIIILGGIVCFFLPHLVNFDQPVQINLYVVFMMYVFNIASSYLFYAYKSSIINANQERYKFEWINIVFIVFQVLVDLFLLVVFKNYYAYLAGKIAVTIIQNLVQNFFINKSYPYLKEKSTIKLTKEEKKGMFKNVFYVFVFKVGSQLFNATDNIIISIFIGTTVVGYYSNYLLIVNYAMTFFVLIVNAFKAGIGNVIATESKEKQYRVFKQINLICFFVNGIFTICLFELLTPFISVWLSNYGQEYLLDQVVVVLCCTNFFIQCSFQVINAFKDASGNYKSGYLLQLFGGIVNIFLSIVFAMTWGLHGILAATIVSELLVVSFPFIFILSKKIFDASPFKIAGRFIADFCIVALTGFVNYLICSFVNVNGFWGLIIKGLITIVFCTVVLFLAYSWTIEHKEIKQRILKIIKEKK